MSEFEAATIAYRQASLVAQQAGLEISRTGVIAAYVQAAVAVGILQAGIVVWGIRAMTKESAKREQHHADRHEESMRRLDTQHKATMHALRELITRTAK